MATELMMIDFQHLRTNQTLEVIPTVQYIKMNGIGMIYTIGDNQDVNDIQQKLMGRTNNSSVS